MTSGFGSLANTITIEHIRDEAPKAPVYLYALESCNPFSKAKDQLKFDLFRLNRSLWLGEMLQTANYELVVPFNSLYMQQAYPLSPIVKSYLGKMSHAPEAVYHRSALQALIQ